MRCVSYGFFKDRSGLVLRVWRQAASVWVAGFRGRKSGACRFSVVVVVDRASFVHFVRV